MPPGLPGDREFIVPAKLIARIAGGDVRPAEVAQQCDPLFRTLSQRAAKQALKALIAYSQDQKDQRHFGRFCGVLVVGAVGMGDEFIQAMNRARLLTSEEPSRKFEQALVELLERLDGVQDQRLEVLRERVATYLTFYRLQLATKRAFGSATATALRTRPFKYGKTLLSLVNHSFLRSYFDFTGCADLAEAYKTFDSPEQLASAASSLIALANEATPLENLDFVLPIGRLDVSSELVKLLRYGHVVSELADVEKQISVLGYRLSVAQERRPTVFFLQAPSQDIEYALRLGFVRGEIGALAAPMHVADDKGTKRYSIRAAVEHLIEKFGNNLYQIADPDNPLRRLTMMIPALPGIFGEIAKWRFYEDVLTDERLAQEFELPLRVNGTGPWELVAGLDLHTFLRAWRVLTFLSVLDMALLKQHQDDERLVHNSLIRVVSKDRLVEMLGLFGLTEGQVRPFLNLVLTTLSTPRHVDLQYRPFVGLKASTLTVDGRAETMPAEVVYGTAVVATANVLPNLQRANGIRIATTSEAFVTAASEYVRRLLPRVRTNAAVKHESKNTDVDIVALGADILYLFECKHSVTPTGAHEFRDLWNDIQKGLSQLELACEILRQRLADYLPGWFPGTPRAAAAGLTLKPCVLCSHRVFSGLTIRGIPIRDQLSLSLMLDEAVLKMGEGGDGEEVTFERYRIRPTENPTIDDLNDYLSDNARYFRLFKPFMSLYTNTERISDSIVLARESFVYGWEYEAWRAQLEQMGAVRLTDQKLALGPAKPPGADAAENRG
jgi:hypothetical protein